MTQPFSHKDVLLYQSISDLNCAYEKNLAACSVKSIDSSNDTTTSAIWILPLHGGEPWKLTAGSANEISPQWSPDGNQLAFISDRAGLNQVFLISVSGGEARQLTALDAAVTSLVWCPDGKRLLATCSRQVDPNLRGARPDPAAPKPSPDAPQVIWKLPYKTDGIGYLLGNETHLYSIDAETGEATQLTDGPFEVRSANWSPDGRQVVYARTREGDESHRTDVWIANADGTGARQVSQDQAQVLFPLWSPDGRRIVFSGSIAEGDAQVTLWCADLDSGQVRHLGDESLEISTEGDSVQFADGDSSNLLAIVAREGVHEVVRIKMSDGACTTLVSGDRQISKLTCSRDFLTFVSRTPTTPQEVSCCQHDGSNEEKVTSFNAWWQDRIQATVERRYFEVPNGEGGSETAQGWLIRPSNAREPAPLLVDFHGGPASYVLFDHEAQAYWSVLWSQGWTILALNAVGSGSFGRRFADRLIGHWGELDFPQHVAALRQLQAEGVADQRLAAIGKSYGSYLTTWAIGHSSIFKAAVVMAPIVNIESHYGTSDSGYYSDLYSMGGDDSEAREAMRRLSPICHAERISTPTLVLQGEKDERCPKSQSEELFVALRRGQSKSSELVIYPGESHKFTAQAKPSYRTDIVQRICEWMSRWASQIE